MTVSLEQVNYDYQAYPTLWDFHCSNDFMRGVMGPIGSGKSSGMCAEILRRAAQQEPSIRPDLVTGIHLRKSRWAVVRNTYRELCDTTQKTWEEWVPAEIRTFVVSDMTYIIKFDDVYAEVMFRALDRPDDVKKLLSLELTGAWVNEAREVAYPIIKMLLGRVGRYPSKRDGGPTWWGVFMDTNPPDDDSWWYKQFEKVRPDEWHLFKQPSSQSDSAENIENLPERYYERLMESNKDDEDWIKVYVHGQYGFVREGKVIYPEYNDHIHTASEPLNLIPDLPVFIGMDFGLTPAACFGQETAEGQWRIFDELVAEDMGTERFGELLSKKIRKDFQKVLGVKLFGDPAGDIRAQTDETTPFDVLLSYNIDAEPAPSNDFIVRRGAVANQLRTMTFTGKPGLIICPKKCPTLRKAMAGRYCYRRLKTADERFADKPDKNNQWSHVAEALQYLLVGAGEGYELIQKPEGASPKTLDYDNRGII